MKKLNNGTKIVKLILKAMYLTKQGFKPDVVCHTDASGCMYLAIYWDDSGFRKHFTIKINQKKG